MTAYHFFAEWRNDDDNETEDCQFFGETAKADAQSAWDNLATLAEVIHLTSIEPLIGVEFFDGFTD